MSKTVFAANPMINGIRWWTMWINNVSGNIWSLIVRKQWVRKSRCRTDREIIFNFYDYTFNFRVIHPLPINSFPPSDSACLPWDFKACREDIAVRTSNPGCHNYAVSTCCLDTMFSGRFHLQNSEKLRCSFHPIAWSRQHVDPLCWGKCTDRPVENIVFDDEPAEGLGPQQWDGALGWVAAGNEAAPFRATGNLQKWVCWRGFSGWTCPSKGEMKKER